MSVYGLVFGPTAVPPDEPTLDTTDNGDGTVTFTVSSATTGTTNTVYTRRANGVSTETWALQATLVGNGSDTVPLVTGDYYAYVRSAASDGQSVISDIILFSVYGASATGPGIRPYTEMRLIAFDLQGVPITYRTHTAKTVTASGTITNTFTDTMISKVLFAPITAQEVEVSNGRYKHGDWRLRIKATDLPETPPSLHSRVKYNSIEYSIYRHYQASDTLVWDIFVRELV